MKKIFYESFAWYVCEDAVVSLVAPVNFEFLQFLILKLLVEKEKFKCQHFQKKVYIVFSNTELFGLSSKTLKI